MSDIQEKLDLATHSIHSNPWKSLGIGVSTLILSAQPVYAQTAEPETTPETTVETTELATSQQASEAAALEEVVVTGSRIARTNGYDTPTPITVMGTAEINAEAPQGIADFVNTLPSVRGSTTAANSSGGLSNGGAGISAINLRALGTGRTLVLFDGQRSVGSQDNGVVDTNTFPQALIERVEVVTGGASSVYGSDAIGGVVNFILDKDYTGVKGAVEYGETTYGDNQNQKYILTAGTPFADGRGHALISGELFNMEGIHYTSRDWNTTGFFAMPNPDGTPGAPAYIIDHNIGMSAYTPGGLITSGPLMGTYFGVDGTVNQLAYGEVGGQWMRGGDWEYSSSAMNGTNSLAPDEDRESIFGRLSYELTSNLEVFAQASYSRYEGRSYYIQPTHRGVTIYADNPYIPDSVAAQMAGLELDSFVIGTNNADMPASGGNNVRKTERYVVGANGTFTLASRGFTWDTYYQRGVTKTDEQLVSIWNNALLALATDAVMDPGTGEIVCRSSLTDPDNGCVPLNRLGVGVASPEALDYVLDDPLRNQKFQQDVFSLNFTMDEIGGWAGPIPIAFGGEWRKEKLEGDVDPYFNCCWKYGNYKVTEGDYDVAEAYFETVVPLIERLEFNGAVRFTDYSTSGAVTTWKAGITYMPIDDITVRVTQSRDIRAPNLGELYATGTARSNSVTINGQSVPFVQNLQGSTELKPEEADTLGIGLILQPRFLPGFAVSFDYYDIKVDGVIDALSAEDTANYCIAQGVQRYCDNMHYDGNGVLQTIDLYFENLNSLEARGLDIEASYQFDAAALIEGAPGNIVLRALATHYIDNITDDGVTAIDQAGSNAGDTPDWVYRVSAMYDAHPWVFNLTARGVSDGVISKGFTECTSDCPESVSPYFTVNDNSVDGEIFFDAYAARSFEIKGVSTEFFFSIKNVLNTDPPLMANPLRQGGENTPGYLQTNRNLYDVLGRTFRLGVRFDWE